MAESNDDLLASPSADGAATRAWLAGIFAPIPPALLAVASDGAIVAANVQAERLFNAVQDDLTGRPFESLFPERLRGTIDLRRHDVSDDPRQILDEGGLALTVQRQDGLEIPVEITLGPLSTSGGIQIISVNGADLPLQGGEQERPLLDAIIEASGDAIISTTDDGIISSWNPAAADLYGYSAAEAIGRPIALTFPPDRSSEVEEILARIRQGEATENLETVRVSRDGRLIEVALTVSPLRTPDGEVIGTAGIVRDISARKRAEALLRESERRFRGAFDAASIGMALVSLAGRFVEVNRSLCEILGYSELRLLNCTFQDLTHPDDLEADLKLVQELLADVRPNYSMEKRYFHNDGSIVWILLSVSLVRDDQGEPLYFVSQIQDITRAREAERLKDEFISTVSHELRTPLTSITGYVDLLLDGTDGELSQTTGHFLTIVQQNSRRLIALVNDLLDMSQIDAGQIDLLREEVNLADQLHGVAAAIAPMMAAKGQTFRLELPDRLPPILADVQRSAQIFTNLVSNAHKYTPEGGSITVSVTVELAAVRVDVIDSGIGLSEEEQARLFTRFFRAGHRAARAVQGTGLGLSITRALIELHGGSIAVRSAPDKGSIFSVTLPMRESRSEREATSSSMPGALLADHDPPSDSAAARILVIEDDSDIGDLLREFLQQEGYEVTMVTTADQAVASVRAMPPDLITLDLMLPDADGWSVLERLRQAGAAIPPVVVVSILPESRYGRPLGVVDYLSKPVRGPILRERVARALAQSRNGDHTP